MSDKDLYLSVADRLPVFFRPWWLEAVHQGAWHAALLERQGQVLAVWPYTIEKKALFTIIRNPLLTPYLGPLWLAEERPEDGWADLLWQQIPKADFLQWSTMPGLHTTSSPATDRTVHQTKRTFCIDLGQPIETIWSGIHTKRKNDIRKAQEDLSITSGFMDVHEFIDWHSASFSGKGKQYPYDATFMERVLNAANTHQCSRAYTAKDKDGRVSGQVWLVFDHHTMYYLLGAAPEQGHRGAIALLIWEALQEAKTLGLRRFDFEGSMDEGIAFYFRRFGGLEIAYNEYSMTNSALWKLKQKIMG